jgi:hypothetical protein
VKLEVSNIGCKRSKLWREPPRAEAAPSAPFSTSDGAIYSANPTTRILLHAKLSTPVLGQGKRGTDLICQ